MTERLDNLSSEIDTRRLWTLFCVVADKIWSAIMLTSVAVLLVLPLAALGMNCSETADGNYEIGCRVYTTCLGGKATVTACEPDTVYNSDTGKCDEPKNVKPPCGQMKDCSNMADDHFADLDNGCHSYYTCVGGAFVGHNFCPASLVFNEDNKACDWPDNVSPPCGTRSGTMSP